jgi:undecaprenyl-diphosphatase
LAAFLTYTGRAVPLTVIGSVALATIGILRAGIVLAIGISVAQLCSQAVVHVAKTAFRRARPEDWLVRAELGFSYPSGHAATAAFFFGSWLVYVLIAPLAQEPKTALAALLVIWAAGIAWSRVALGAHYPIDVAGGTLVGLSSLCFAWAIFLRAGLLAWH